MGDVVEGLEGELSVFRFDFCFPFFCIAREGEGDVEEVANGGDGELEEVGFDD